MGKSLLIIIIFVMLDCASISVAQDIYIYPNKRLADQGLIEYRRYTLDEARAYQQGGSFEPLLTTAWSAERRLTNDDDVYSPRAISRGDSLFCSYFILTPHIPYFISSHDGGLSWGTSLLVADTSIQMSYTYPELAKDGSNLLMVCSIYNFNIQGFNLGYFLSLDNGQTWGAIHNILPYYRLNRGNYSSLGFSGRNVYCSYADYDNDSIYVVKSTNFGTTWNGNGVNVAYLNGTPQPMTIRASDSTIHLVWVNEVMPVSVRYSRNTNAGQIWTPEIDIAQDPFGAQECYASVQGQHVVVSWKGYKFSPYMFTGDMFIKQSYDGGATWDSATVLTDLHYVWMGSNYIKDSLIMVTWQDTRFGGNNNESMARYSTDYGVTWSEEVRLSYGDYDSHSPVACATEDRIHVLWGDGRRDAPGLYYSFNDMYNSIDNELVPSNYSRLTAFPNPFNSSVIFKYQSQNESDIKIYNIVGQLVRTLPISRKEVQTTWNGTNDDGKPLSSGIYLAVINTSGGMQQVKVTYLK